jgi:prepilin-type N-terminal cleavage/methylation domain-containing protein
MRRNGKQGAAGFSLVELMVVMAVIGIVAGTAIPAISNYLRTYAVRAASASVTQEIQTARAQAIKRNANYGVGFAILSNRTYQYYGRDAQGMTNAPSGLPPGTRRNLGSCPPGPAACAVTDGLAGPLRTLPPDFRFRVAGAAGAGFCFDRLGMRQAYGTSQCANDDGVPAVNYWTANASGSEVWLVIERISNTGINRTIVVASGGRVFQP